MSFQFPTGWNSTIAEFFYKAVDGSFQFPTGWNSTYIALKSMLTKYVSIPNGMEFYLYIFVHEPTTNGFNSQRDGILQKSDRQGGLFDFEFQFPTGWNSTKNEVLSLRWSDGFNSQRDGILLIPEVMKKDITLFQFPTGWNSTIGVRDRKFRIVASFNSQRDGILRSASLSQYAPFKFQFPTGWNSTYKESIDEMNDTVSIPNGMEFYPLLNGAWNSWSSFNSQRDGILQYVLPLPGLPTMVSIPNGMEFYLRKQKNRVKKRSFNSQRDGILRKFSLGELAGFVLVSIPNGMEFYSTNFAIFLGRKC